jgi:hypothetical protein
LLIVHPFPAGAHSRDNRRDQALGRGERREAVRKRLAVLEDAGMEFTLTHSAFKNHGCRQMNRFQKRPN